MRHNNIIALSLLLGFTHVKIDLNTEPQSFNKIGCFLKVKHKAQNI